MGCNSLSKYLAPGPWQPVPQHSQRRNWKQTKRSASSANAFSLATLEIKIFSFLALFYFMNSSYYFRYATFLNVITWEPPTKNIKNQTFFCSSSFPSRWQRWFETGSDCARRQGAILKSWSGHWDRAERQFMSSQFEFEFEKKVNIDCRTSRQYSTSLTINCDEYWALRLVWTRFHDWPVYIIGRISSEKGIT